jgi:hypothetical protein
MTVHFAGSVSRFAPLATIQTLDSCHIDENRLSSQSRAQRLSFEGGAPFHPLDEAMVELLRFFASPGKALRGVAFRPPSSVQSEIIPSSNCSTKVGSVGFRVAVAVLI